MTENQERVDWIITKDGLRPRWWRCPRQNQERDDRAITKYSWRVEICRHNGFWAAYYGKKRASRNDDEFTGWFEDPDELLCELYNHLPQRVYDAVLEAA